MTRRAPLLAVLAALLLALAAWFLLFTPEREERATLQAEIDGLRTRQQQQKLEIARLEEIKRNELDVRAQIARLEEYIPSGPGQPSTLRQIQLAADRAGVEITGLTFGDPQAVAGAPPPQDTQTVLAEIPVTLTVWGGYFQGTDLLRRIETELPRAFLVESVAITEGGDPPDFPTLEIVMNGRIFARVPASAVAGPAGAPVPGAPPAPGQSPGATPSPSPSPGAPA